MAPSPVRGRPGIMDPEATANLPHGRRWAVIIVVVIGAVAVIGVVSVLAIRRGASEGWWRDPRFLVGVVLVVVGAFGMHAASGKPWPGGPALDVVAEAWMVLGGLVAVVIGSTMLARGIREPHVRS